MPASSIAVRPSPLSSSSSKDPFPYSASGMGSSLEKVTLGKTGANLNTTNRGNNKIYAAMAMTLNEHPLLQSSSSTKLAPSTSSPPRPKKATPQRPTTPHGNTSGQINFVERNKQLASSKASPTPTKLTSGKSLSPPVSPQPSLKRVVAQSSRPISEKPLTTTTTTKKTTEAPATVQKSPAHVRSHAAAPRTASSSSSSSDAALIEQLTRENKRLKGLLTERTEELREAENDVEEFQEVIESLQERIREVEARNRELKSENDILRAKVVENGVKEQKIAAAQSPSKLVSDIINNQNKILGEETNNPVPKIAPINIPAIPTTPASVTSPAVVPTPTTQTSVLSTLLLASKSNAPKVNDTNAAVSAQREPEAPVPAVTPEQYHGRVESSRPRNEMLDRHVEMFRDREAANKAKALAALNAVMEESDESEEEEYPFGREEDYIPDVQTFSDTGSTPEEDNDYDEEEDQGFPTVPFDGSHTFSPIEEEDEEDYGDDEEDRYNPNEDNIAPLQEDIEKWKSTELNAIMEDEDEEDDEFELNSNLLNHPKQYIDQISAAAMKSTKRSAPRRLRRYSANSSNSDSGIGSAHNSPQNSNSGHSVFDLTPHSIHANNASSQKFADSQLVSDNGYIKQRLQNFVDNSAEKSDDHFYGIHRGSITSTYSDESDTPSHSSTATSHSSQSSNSSAPQALTSCTENDIQTSGKRYGQPTHFDDIHFQQFGENSTTGKYSQQNGNPQNTRLNNFNDYSNEQRSQSATSRRSSASSEHSMAPVSRLPSQTRSASRQVNDYVPRAQSPAGSSRSSTPMSDYRRKVTSPYHPASSNNSSRASTPSNYPARARAPSPPSTRSSTPASESSRTASRQMNHGQIPPPPSPPATKDVFTTLQHYLRLLSGSCCLENPTNYYDVKQQLDEGSSAQVFSAVSRKTKQEVAIKIIPLSYSLEFIFNELYVLRNLKHQNIVEFKESFLRWDGKTREIWIVMEKCARGDVTGRAGKVTQKEVARITRDLLASLKHLHANGIIHRDIKLSNILMTAKGEVKLADFGISSLTPTSTTGMVGTIPYMAPDIVTVSSDRPYSTKVDIWSLGVCVLELLTGRAAWGRIRDDEIMIRLRRGDKPYGFERLRAKSPDMSWEATDFLERCFARDEVRYSAEELLQHPFIKNNCISSRPNQCPQI